MKKSTEEVIGQVLAGLRGTEASAGMERRILQAVEERASTRSTSMWRWSSWSSWGWGGTFAAALVICGVIAISTAKSHGPGQPEVRVVPVKAAPVTDSVRVAEDVQPVPAVTLRVRKPARRARFVDVKDAASADMRAVSYPAPPMPLTEQEKLLLRIAHKRDPEEVAMLNPQVRARQEAEGKVEFQQFFEPSTKGNNE